MSSYNKIYNEQKKKGYGDRSYQIYGARLATYFMLKEVGIEANASANMLGVHRTLQYNMDKILSNKNMFASFYLEKSFTEMVSLVSGECDSEHEYTYEDLLRMIKMKDAYIAVLENIV